VTKNVLDVLQLRKRTNCGWKKVMENVGKYFNLYYIDFFIAIKKI